MKWINTSVVAAGILLVMNGCGGGSSSGTVETSSATLSGVAVDDLILNGVVTATDTVPAVLAEGRTSKMDGTYALNVNYDGIVLLNVSCDENSTMWNPVNDISTAVACEEGLSLHSVADVSAGVAQTINISPLTEIVYQRALVLAGDRAIDETDFDDARAEIGVMFGVDPIAGDPTEGMYADIIDAIHMIAEQSESSVLEVTLALAEELSDGSADGADGDDLINDLVDALITEGVTNNLTINDGDYTPPVDAANMTDIEAAKALFDELRTQAMSVVDYQNSGTPGFLDTESQSMNEAVNNIAMNVGVIEELMTYLSWDMEYMLENNLTEYSVLVMTAPGTWTYSFDWENGITYSGTLSIPTSVLEGTVDIYDFTTLKAEIQGTFPLEIYSPVEDGVEDIQYYSGSIELTKTESGANVTISGDISSNGTTFTLKEATAEVAYSEGAYDTLSGTFEPKLDYFKLHNVTLQGSIGEYTIDGSITVNSYVQNQILVELESINTEDFENSGWLPDDVTFTGAISREGASINGSINGKWKDAATFNPQNEEDYTPLVEVSVSGKLQMPERPEMLINLGFENNTTNNMFTASYSYDTTLITLDATFDIDMMLGDVNIATHTGLRADFTLDNARLLSDQLINGTVTKDGALVGTFEEREDIPVIKYIDGTFESLP